MPPTLVCDDVMQWAATYAGPAFHALLCDAPYHLISDTRNGSMRTPGTGPYGRHTISTKSTGFMGKDWDGGDIAFRPETWAALAHHLLPGAFVMAFASSRGYHRLACALEDAGLILHPSIFNYRSGETLDIGMMGWSNGAGFPKATKIDTQLDAAAGVERVVLGDNPCRTGRQASSWHEGWSRPWQANPDAAAMKLTAPATPLAQTWAGHRYGGQALKPALEPIIVAQKPYAGRPVDSITEYGAGALWIEGGRIGDDAITTHSRGNNGAFPKRPGEVCAEESGRVTDQRFVDTMTKRFGRWPTNFVLCHLPACERRGTSQVPGDPRGACNGTRPGGFANVGALNGAKEPNARVYGDETVPTYRCTPGCPVAVLDGQAGERPSGSGVKSVKNHYGGLFRGIGASDNPDMGGDSGPASRFFFTADWSLDVAEQLAQAEPAYYCPKASAAERHAGTGGRNSHPCIKPLALVRWLATLLLPPAAYTPRRLLVPFAGTGSEMIGGILAGWETVCGIENDETSVDVGRKRIAWWTGYTVPFTAPSERAPQTPTRTTGNGQLNLFGRA